MTYKRAVRDIYSDKPTPPKVLDIIVDDEDTVKLEIKPQKDRTVLPWEYICSQVEGFRQQKQKMISMNSIK